MRGLLSYSVFCTRGNLRTFNLQRIGIAVPRFCFVSYAESYEGILVTLVDGTTTTISFSEKPVIKFQSDKLVVHSDAVSTEFDRSKVSRFNYVTDLSGVDGIDRSAVTIGNNGSTLYLSNLPTDSAIDVYSSDGKLLESVRTTGNHTIEISGLPAGVYIVSVNGVSTKITKQP